MKGARADLVLCCLILAYLSQVSSHSLGPNRGRHLSKRSEEGDSGEPDCIKCQPGTFATKPCFHGVATVCKSCPSGTFTDHSNLLEKCLPCSVCGAGMFEVEACTSTSDVACKSCSSPAGQKNPACLGMVDADVAEMYDMMQGDDHTTLSDDVHVKPTSSDVKPPDDVKPDDGGVVDTNGEEIPEEAITDDVKIEASSADDVDAFLETITQPPAVEEGEGSGDVEEERSDILKETPSTEGEGEAVHPSQTPTPSDDTGKETGVDANYIFGEETGSDAVEEHVKHEVSKEEGGDTIIVPVHDDDDDDDDDKDDEATPTPESDADEDKQDTAAVPEDDVDDDDEEEDVTPTPEAEAEKDDEDDGDVAVVPVAASDDDEDEKDASPTPEAAEDKSKEGAEAVDNEDDDKDDVTPEPEVTQAGENLVNVDDEEDTDAKKSEEEEDDETQEDDVEDVDIVDVDDSPETTAPPGILAPTEAQQAQEKLVTTSEPAADDKDDDEDDDNAQDQPGPEPTVPITVQEGGDNEDASDDEGENSPSSTSASEAIVPVVVPQVGASLEGPQTDSNTTETVVSPAASTPGVVAFGSIPGAVLHSASLDLNATAVDEGEGDANVTDEVDTSPLPEEKEKPSNRTADDVVVLPPDVTDHTDDKDDDEKTATATVLEGGEAQLNETFAVAETDDDDDDGDDGDDDENDTTPAAEADEEGDTISTPETSSNETDDDAHLPVLLPPAGDGDDDDDDDDEDETTLPTTEASKNDTDDDSLVPVVFLPSNDDDDDDDDEEEEHTTIPAGKASSNETDDDTHVPIAIPPSEDDDDDDDDVKDSSIPPATATNETDDAVLPSSGDHDVDDDDKDTTVLPTAETSSNDTDDVVPPIVLPPPDDDVKDEDEDDKPSTSPIPEEAKNDTDTDDVIPVVPIVPDGEQDADTTTSSSPVATSSSDDLAQTQLVTDVSPVPTVTSEPKSKAEDTQTTSSSDDTAQATTPSPPSATTDDDDDGVDIIVPVVDPSIPPVSTTQRIPTLEEIESTQTPEEGEETVDLGSGEVPGIVIGGEKGAEPEYNVTEGAKPGGKVGGVDVVIGTGEGNETRRPPGRPGDGTRRGEGQVILIGENENGEEESEETNETNEHLEIESSRHGDTEEDVESKKRTALIVGVAIGGVALFAIGFFTSRHCKKRRKFKVMKKVEHDNGPVDGKDESIEFRPLHGGSGIYDEVDEVGHAASNNGSYRKMKEGGYTPVATSPAPAVSTFTAPSGDTYAVVNKKRQPPPKEEVHDPHVNGIDKIRYIDETTDDEGGEPSVHDRLLPSKRPHAALPEVVEEESKIKPPEPEKQPSTSGDSETSLSTDLIGNLDKKMANGGSSEGLGSEISDDVPPKEALKSSQENLVRRENGLAQS